MSATHHATAGRKGAHTMWANTVDRAARTRNARTNSPVSVEYHLARLPAQFDNATPTQRQLAAENARRAYMSGLALKSAAARRKAS